MPASIAMNCNRKLARRLREWANIAGLKSFTLLDLNEFMNLLRQPEIVGALGLTEMNKSCLGANFFNLLEPTESM
ncbi:hypothetical protein FBU59_006947 [Linderina macrospora]|uniref:Uncharacterized protein n=1 Tax=Linderina macrospora TaxID=4868 RepID=A0ACC1IYI2_9FUNG|nr:hypothetical protein FBU59_006947 [Linderina macrospora]